MHPRFRSWSYLRNYAETADHGTQRDIYSPREGGHTILKPNQETVLSLKLLFQDPARANDRMSYWLHGMYVASNDITFLDANYLDWTSGGITRHDAFDLAWGLKLVNDVASGTQRFDDETFSETH